MRIGAVIVILGLMLPVVVSAATYIGADAVVPVNPRSLYCRYVNWRPADGETVNLNPPRMSWPFRADWPENWGHASHIYTLQISEHADCSDPVVDVTCEYNFYNTLPALQPGRRYFWRVGYDVGTPSEVWRQVRSFVIAEDATEWDRSALAELDMAQVGHPRICFNSENLEEIRSLAEEHPSSKAAMEQMLSDAEAIMDKPWWDEFPETDRAEEPKQSFYTIARDLAKVAFVWKMTGDDKYSGVVDRAVTWASYPPGGRASPEGFGTGDGNEDATQGNEFLALLFDWLYNDMTPDQRTVMIHSLQWRTDHIMNSFSFRTGRSSGAMIRLTFRSDNEPQVVEAEDFDLSGAAEVIEHEKASGKNLVELAGEDARLERTFNLQPAEYILEVAGYGPAGTQDAFYVSIDDGPQERLYINGWGEKITRFDIQEAGSHTVVITPDPNEIGMTIDRVTVRVHEDHRLRLPQTEEWSEIDWDVPVPEGADTAVLEFFNYYAGGNVWWSELAVTAEGENLVTNTALQPAENDTPSNWRFHAYGTEGTGDYKPEGGPDGDGAVGIICPDDSDRGSWGQGLDIGDQETVTVTGWYRTGGHMLPAPLKASGMAGMISSHPYESGMDTAVCGLALAGHSELGDEWFEVCLNYLIGITCGHGFDEAWNEGAGYGTSKCKWLSHATMYYDTALAEANLGRNPFYNNITDWFSRIIPVGMDHHAWGNQRNASRGNHLAHFRKFAYLTGDGTDLLNWQEYGGELFRNFRPWIEYVLPGYYAEPEPEPEKTYSRMFDIAGWAMAASGPPSLASTYEEGTGVIFQCRARGGYGHSFNSDGSVQLHAYGQMLNHGGGSSANQDAFAYHTMSHNTILVDGLGQAQPGGGMAYPTYGHICGYDVGEDYVYFSGDVTRCYPHEPGNYARWGLPLDNVYTERALPYLQRYLRHILYVNEEYFVIYDDLESTQPATYTWLYHIMPEEPFEFDPQTFTCRYEVGGVPVVLKQIYRPEALALDDRRGEDGLVNPITDEDYREYRRGDIISAHHLWVSNEEPSESWRFLAVIYPQPPGGEVPTIEGLDDNTVRVDDEVICFDPSSEHAEDADIVVDIEAFRPAQ